MKVSITQDKSHLENLMHAFKIGLHEVDGNTWSDELKGVKLISAP